MWRAAPVRVRASSSTMKFSLRSGKIVTARGAFTIN
jgi:hypothetical protein